VTILNNLDDAATVMIPTVRPPSGKHFVYDARPRIHIGFGSHGCSVEQLLRGLIAPCSRRRRVSVVRELIHEDVKRRIRNAYPAIVVDQYVGRTDVPVANVHFVQVAYSLNDLHDLMPFVGIGVSFVMIKDISLRVIRDFILKR